MQGQQEYGSSGMEPSLTTVKQVLGLVKAHGAKLLGTRTHKSSYTGPCMCLWRPDVGCRPLTLSGQGLLLNPELTLSARLRMQPCPAFTRTKLSLASGLVFGCCPAWVEGVTLLRCSKLSCPPSCLSVTIYSFVILPKVMLDLT